MHNIPNKNEYFLNMIDVVKTRSKDRSSKVGCVIVSENDSVLSMGYNGFPRGINDDIEERYERPLKYLYMEHSERNAIYNAARNGVNLEGASIYLEIWPCVDCARGIVQSGIKNVIVDGRNYSENLKIWMDRWEESISVGIEIMLEAGVNCYIWFSRHNNLDNIIYSIERKEEWKELGI